MIVEIAYNIFEINGNLIGAILPVHFKYNGGTEHIDIKKLQKAIYDMDKIFQRRVAKCKKEPGKSKNES